MAPCIQITTTNEYLRIYSQDLLYIEADRDYSDIYLTDGEKAEVIIQLGKLEEIIEYQLHQEARAFVRIGRSLIINTNYIFKIIPQKKKLILKANGRRFELEAAREALVRLKTALDDALMAPFAMAGNKEGGKKL